MNWEYRTDFNRLDVLGIDVLSAFGVELSESEAVGARSSAAFVRTATCSPTLMRSPALFDHF